MAKKFSPEQEQDILDAGDPAISKDRLMSLWYVKGAHRILCRKKIMANPACPESYVVSSCGTGLCGGALAYPIEVMNNAATPLMTLSEPKLIDMLCNRANQLLSTKDNWLRTNRGLAAIGKFAAHIGIPKDLDAYRIRVWYALERPHTPFHVNPGGAGRWHPAEPRISFLLKWQLIWAMFPGNKPKDCFDISHRTRELAATGLPVWAEELGQYPFPFKEPT